MLFQLRPFGSRLKKEKNSHTWLHSGSKHWFAWSRRLPSPPVFPQRPQWGKAELSFSLLLSLSLCVCVWPNGCWWPNMCSSDRTAEQTGDGSCANGRLSRLRCHDHICAPPGYQALLIITRGTFSEIGPPFISRECRIEELARGDNDFKLPFRQLIPRSGVKQKSAVRCVYVDTIWNHNSGLKVHYSAEEPEQDVSVRESNNIVRVMTTNYWFLFGLRLRKQQKADIDM